MVHLSSRPVARIFRGRVRTSRIGTQFLAKYLISVAMLRMQVLKTKGHRLQPTDSKVLKSGQHLMEVERFASAEGASL